MQYSLAQKEDLPRAIDVLSEAFFADPVVSYISDDPRCSRAIYSLISGFYLKNGEIWMNSDKTAVLLCLPPKNCRKRFYPSIFALVKIIYMLGFSPLIRVVKHCLVTEKNRPLIPHYYIHAIGTTNESRNKGYAGEIMRFFMKRAKGENAYLYGENTNPEMNTGLYTYLGFDHSDPISIAENGPEFIPTFKDYSADVSP